MQDLNREIRAEVLYLPEYLKDDLARVREGRRWAKTQPGYASALKAFRADLERDASVNRLRRFGQACVLAHELPADVAWIHTHYLHTPASVARYAALIRGMGWSFSAHAKDIWTTPEWELRDKLADAAWGVTCTRANLDYLRSLSTEPKKIHLVYHGLDFSRFPPPPERKARSNGPFHDCVGRACGGEEGLFRPAPGAGADPRRAATGASSMPVAAPGKAPEGAAAKLGISDRIIWHGAQDRAFIFSCSSAPISSSCPRGWRARAIATDFRTC